MKSPSHRINANGLPSLASGALFVLFACELEPIECEEEEPAGHDQECVATSTSPQSREPNQASQYESNSQNLADFHQRSHHWQVLLFAG